MALEAIIKQEAYEGLLDGLKPEYKKQDDGTFILDVTPVNDYALENVKGLKSALSTERTAKEDAQNLIKAFNGLDPEKAKQAIAKVEGMANWKPDEKVKEQIETITKQLTEKHAGELSAKGELVDSLTAQLEKVLIEAAAIKAIAENKGNTALLLPHVKSNARMKKDSDGQYVVDVFDADGNSRISMASGSTAPMSISELVAEMKISDTFAPAFDGNGASGSGASGGKKGGHAGKNPWDKDSYNLTEQMKLTKENPTLAANLKANAAG